MAPPLCSCPSLAPPPVRLPPWPRPLCPGVSVAPPSPERSPAGGACLGCFGARAGRRAAGAQVRRGLRGLFTQREVHRQCGLPARHDGERVELEGVGGSSSLMGVAWRASSLRLVVCFSEERPGRRQQGVQQGVGRLLL